MKNFSQSFLSFCLVMVLSGWATVAFAQPANNDCANAILLTSTPNSSACTVTSGTTAGATQSIPGECSGNADDDVWYKFVAASAEETITVSNPVGFTGITIDARSGACNGTSIGCTLTAAPAVLNLTQLTVGATYLLRVYSGGVAIGTFDICVQHPAPPANDNCANATNLTPTAGVFTDPGTQNNSGATASLGGASCSGSASIAPIVQDVWYSFTTDADGGSAVISVDPGNATGDPLVHYFTSCANGPLCYDLSGPGVTETTPAFNGLAASTTYYFRVYGQNTAPFPFTISVTGTALAPPVNNDCSGAIALPISPASGCSYTAVNTAAATQSAGNPSCTTTGNNDDVWYSFTPTTTGPLLISYNSLVGVSAVYEIYTGACGALVPVAGSCGPIGVDGGADDNETTVSLTAGTNYYLRLWTGGTTGFGSFNLCLQIPPAVPNYDDCANAVALTSNTNCVNTAGTTVSATQTLPAVCGTSADDDVWFKFTAVATAHTIHIANYSGFTCGVINAFASCGGASLGCSTNGTLALTSLTINQVYVFRVHSCGFAVGTFNVCVTHTVLPLELKSFTGKVEATANLLNWETATEKNVQSHIIERSVDGQRWSEIGHKAAKGDSQVAVKYTLEDRAPIARAYYRLRSVDFDGKENFSSSIVLTRNSSQFGITSVFPSPTVDNVTVQFNSTQEEKVIVRVMDATGRLVLEKTLEAAEGINELPVTLTGLQAGFYTVKVSNNTGTSAPVRFVKQ